MGGAAGALEVAADGQPRGEGLGGEDAAGAAGPRVPGQAVAPSGDSATPQPEAWMLGFQAVRVREAMATEAKL